MISALYSKAHFHSIWGTPRIGLAARMNSTTLYKCRQMNGFATPEGTQSFLMRKGVDLPLHHHFEISGLFVNPIIHGPPLRRLSKRKEEAYMLQAISEHKCNAFFVFDHYSGTFGSRLQIKEGNSGKRVLRVQQITRAR